jgi:hypothetical protein
MGMFASIGALLGLGGALSPKRIAQASKLACNPFAQPEVRMRELQRLLKDRTPQSIEGAVRRFGANAQGHIADEEEKTWLTEALVELESDARAPLEAYITTGQKLTYALDAYRRVVDGNDARVFFCRVLTDIGPADHQRVEAKQQLVVALRPDGHEPEVQAALAPFAADHADDVVWSVLDVVDGQLAKPAGPSGTPLDARLLAGLGELLTRPDTSARISRRVAELLARCGAPVGVTNRPLPPSISDQYFVDGQGIVHVRASA